SCAPHIRGHLVLFQQTADNRHLHSFPTRRSSDLLLCCVTERPRNTSSSSSPKVIGPSSDRPHLVTMLRAILVARSMSLEAPVVRSEEHTSELQSRENLVCRLLLEKKKRYV